MERKYFYEDQIELGKQLKRETGREVYFEDDVDMVDADTQETILNGALTGRTLKELVYELNKWIKEKGCVITRQLVDLHDLVDFIKTLPDYSDSGRIDYDTFTDALGEWLEENKMETMSTQA